MQQKTKNRLIWVIFFVISSALGVYIILYNLRQNITFFYPPTKVYQLDIQKLSKDIRIGGVVKNGSVYHPNIDETEFVITDYQAEITIKYCGVLPALFRVNQGIIVKGSLIKVENHYVLFAKELLVKHDEKYTPPTAVK
jgi:cytochrome c-type biogenesis protein CcmE